MAQEKDGFGNDNEISRFEDEEETGADRGEIVETDEEEVIISERPVGAGASEASGEAPGAKSKKKSKAARKSKAKKVKAKSKVKAKAKRKAKAAKKSGRRGKRR